MRITFALYQWLVRITLFDFLGRHTKKKNKKNLFVITGEDHLKIIISKSCKIKIKNLIKNITIKL